MIKSDRIEAWSGLLRITRALHDAIEADLKEAGYPPPGWYDVLFELTRADPHGLRQVDLRDRLALAQYTVSRLLDRMEAAGLIVRVISPTDKRSQIIRPTDAGLELLDAMWPVYRDAIAQRFGARLSDADTARLNALIDRFDSAKD